MPISVAASLLVAGVVVGLVTANASSTARSPAKDSHHTPMQLLAMDVRIALQNSSSLIEATTQTMGMPGNPSFTPPFSVNGWFYGDQDRIQFLGTTGNPVGDISTTVQSGTRTRLVVSYAQQEWSKTQEPYSGDFSGLNVAGAIQSGLANGSLTQVGDAPYDGAPAIEVDLSSSGDFSSEVLNPMLVFLGTVPRPGAVRATASSVELWIDPTTDLPLQAVISFPGSNANTLTTQFAWESPTEADVAQLIVSVPRGYTEVPGITGFPTK